MRRPQLYQRIRQILESARTNVARSVNTTQVAAYWLVGREIVEEEQQGKRRAGYGEQLLAELSGKLTGEFGKGFSVRNLEYCRNFYIEYPRLLEGMISNAVRSIFPTAPDGTAEISHGVRAKSDAASRQSSLTSPTEIGYAVRSQSAIGLLPAGNQIRHAPRSESWKPGRLHPNLSWTHYRTLLRVDKAEARAFYEIEALKNNSAARELERQINSLLYERLALSKDKKGLMRLATKGHKVQQPADVFKDPVVMEFLGLPESPKLVESSLEEALINNLQAFLLELGKGFAFVARQERLTLDGDHFYIDLVFYHTVLKCYVIIDLKTGKLTHQDLGQLQLYVNYYDHERRTKGDNPTLGLILCADKNDAVVKYTLGPHQEKKIFASRYKLYLPTEAELKAEIRRELEVLRKEEKP
jgi:predicted nuclease of restriction endonuclease-like (RecB) superfamily